MITYNPDVHIKKERQEQDNGFLDLEVINNGTSMQETSTITMEKSGDEVKASIMEAFVQYFDAGGDCLRSSEDFLLVWTQQLGNRGEMQQGQIEISTKMPRLPGMAYPVAEEQSRNHGGITETQDIATTSEKNMVTVAVETTQNEDNGNIDMVRPNQEPSIANSNRSLEENKTDKECESLDDLSKYEGEINCEKCEFFLYNCSTHNHSSLLKEYGPGMKCVGKGCDKTLYHCLNEMHKDVRGAFICEGCQERKCRQMKCNVCYFREEGSKRKKRNTQGKA